MFSGARSSYETPDGLITNSSAPGTRPDTLPAGPRDETVADELGVQSGHFGAHAGDGDLGLDPADIPGSNLGVIALHHGAVSLVQFG